MKIFLLSTLLCFLTSPAFAAIALIANTCGGAGANGGTTSAINTTGATLIVLAISFYDDIGSNVPTDSQSNTWTALNDDYNSPNGIRLFYVNKPTTSSSHTFSISTASPIYSVICAAAFNGTMTSSSPFDVQNSGGTEEGTTLAPGSVTPNVNNELLITGMSGYPGNPVSIDSGFTIPSNGTVNGSAGVNSSIGIAYLVQTTAASTDPNWTQSSGNSAATDIATFKALVSTSLSSTVQGNSVIRGNSRID